MEDIKKRLDILGYGDIDFTNEIFELVFKWCESYIKIFCCVTEIKGELEEIRDDFICVKLIERAVLNGELDKEDGNAEVASIKEGDFSISFSECENAKEMAKKTALNLMEDIKMRMISFRRFKWN